MPGANRTENRQPPWDQPEGEVLSFGTWLRRQREIRQVPLREIADVTKISVRYLEALEQDRFDILPAPVFAKGFLREYARYVGLDPDEVVNQYLAAQESAEEDDNAGEEPATDRRSREWTGVLLAAAVVALLVLAAALFFYAERTRGDAEAAVPPPMAAPPPRVVEEPAVPTPQPVVPSVPLLVTMDFTEDCWVEVSIDGERQIRELYVQGESMRVEAQERVLLTLGNPTGVHLEVNGMAYDFPVAPGRVARDIDIGLATVEELTKALP